MKTGFSKYIKAIILVLFFVIVIISFVLVSYLFRPVSNSRKNICGFYAEENNTLDMVYVGGSACYYYWEPLAAFNQYGFTSYNFATDGIPPQLIKYCIKEILKTQTPEVILVDLRPFQYGDTYDEESGDLRYLREPQLRNVIDNMKYSFNRISTIQNCVPEDGNRIFYHFDISKYHSLLASLVNKENWQHIFNEYPYDAKGFSYHTNIHSYEKEDFSHVREEVPLSETMDTLFIDLLEYCKEEKLQVLFVVHPYTIVEIDQKKYNYMNRRIKEYGFDFLNSNDYTDDMGLNFATDFHDGVHVNLLGADKYTMFLGEFLSENYEFVDKRDDDRYVSWNDAYIKWIPEIEQVREELRNK